jgi:hypothetical protein
MTTWRPFFIANQWVGALGDTRKTIDSQTEPGEHDGEQTLFFLGVGEQFPEEG